MLVVAEANLPGLDAGQVTDVDGSDAQVKRLVAAGYLRKASAGETAAYKERHGEPVEANADPARAAAAEKRG